MRKTAAAALALSLAPAFAAYANDNQFEQAASLDDLIEYAAPEGYVGFIYYSSSPDAEAGAQEIASILYTLSTSIDRNDPVQFFIVPPSSDIQNGSVQGVNSQGVMEDIFSPRQARNRIFLSTIINDDAPIETDPNIRAELEEHLETLRRQIEEAQGRVCPQIGQNHELCR